MESARTASRPGHGARRSGARTETPQPGTRAPLPRPRDGEVRVGLRGLGSMAVGVVQAIGAHAVGFARGDRVVFPVTRGERLALREPDPAAGNTDTLLVDADRLLGIPRDVSDEQAARLLAPGLVARVLLRQLRLVKTGDRVQVDLDAGIGRSVVVAWAVNFGATEAVAGETADLVIEKDAFRRAHGIAFRRGHLQTGSADVFAAIRDGVFDLVLAEPDSTEDGRAAA